MRKEKARLSKRKVLPWKGNLLLLCNWVWNFHYWIWQIKHIYRSVGKGQVAREGCAFARRTGGACPQRERTEHPPQDTTGPALLRRMWGDMLWAKEKRASLTLEPTQEDASFPTSRQLPENTGKCNCKARTVEAFAKLQGETCGQAGGCSLRLDQASMLLGGSSCRRSLWMSLGWAWDRGQAVKKQALCLRVLRACSEHRTFSWHLQGKLALQSSSGNGVSEEWERRSVIQAAPQSGPVEIYDI